MIEAFIIYFALWYFLVLTIGVPVRVALPFSMMVGALPYLALPLFVVITKRSMK